MIEHKLFHTYFYVWVLLIIEDPTVIVMVWFIVFSATFNSVLIGWNYQKSLETTQPMLLIYWVNDARVNLYQIHVFGADPKSKASAMAGQTYSKGHYHHQYGRYWYINIFSQLLNWTHTTGCSFDCHLQSLWDFVHYHC